ncbi:putative defense protein 2 [Lytechinus variegatus]|uniref:putative defense protein 2 n=1 Tax=Lytechinus variegatus TaxID=7654 RepID=UPI001BB23BA7|nr:putative defense protein 2 [Lytechinus variegatus]
MVRRVLDLVGLLILQFISTSPVEAYPNGAPADACAKAAPQHLSSEGQMINPQTGPCPYTFTVDSTVYKIGQKITVTIEGSQTFGGFLIQARSADDKPVGRFKSLPSNSQLRGCGGRDNNGVTHTSADPKLPGMKFEWYTKKNEGTIKFFGTVAKDHDVFWTEITSSEIQYDDDEKVINIAVL